MRQAVAVPFKGQMDIEIDGQEGRLRVPPALIGGITTPDKDGWLPLQKINVGTDAITAIGRFKFLNRQKPRIDRVHGTAELGEGARAYTAKCEINDPSKPHAF